MLKNKLYRQEDTIFRILEEKEERVLVIDCVKKSLPKWISCAEMTQDVEISEEEFLQEMGMEFSENLSASARRVMRERFTVIAGILPYVGEKRKRSVLISAAAKQYQMSLNTVKSYLGTYLVYQDILALAPKEKKTERELTPDEKI